NAIQVGVAKAFDAERKVPGSGRASRAGGQVQIVHGWSRRGEKPRSGSIRTGGLQTGVATPEVDAMPRPGCRPCAKSLLWSLFVVHCWDGNEQRTMNKPRLPKQRGRSLERDRPRCSRR